MDPGKRVGDSSSRPVPPAGDLAAYLKTMSLSEPSSSRQPAAAAPRMQQMYAPAAAMMQPAPVPPHSLMQELQMARQHWSQPQQQYGAAAGSSSGAYGPPFGAAAPYSHSNGYASPGESSSSGAYGPLLAATAPYSHSNGYASPFGTTTTRSGSTSASGPSTSAQPSGEYHYQPTAVSHPSQSPPPCTLSASASQYQPVAAPILPASRRTAPSSSNGQYPPLPSHYYQPPDAYPAQDYYHTRGHVPSGGASSSVQDHGSPPRRTMRYLQQGYDLRAPLFRRGRTLQELRSELLSGPLDPQLATFPESAAHVIRLLEEGDEGMRLNILAGVKSSVHKVMENSSGHAVFLTLLRFCEESYDDLSGIVEAAVQPNGRGSQLLRLARQPYGEAALTALMLAAAPHPDLCMLLIKCLHDEGLMDHCKGGQLLQQCFATMPYEEVTRDLVVYALDQIKYDGQNAFSSSHRSKCLTECLANALGDDLRELEELLLSHANIFARGQYSNYFVQRFLKYGPAKLRKRARELILHDAVSLSQDQYGSYVVEACFLHAGSIEPMRRILQEFVAVRDSELVELVKGAFSNYVVNKLLELGREYCPKEALKLARRIEKLPRDVLCENHAMQVMRVVRKLFPRQHHDHLVLDM